MLDDILTGPLVPIEYPESNIEHLSFRHSDTKQADNFDMMN